MTSTDPDDGQASSTVGRYRQDHGPYVLRSLLDDVPLSADGSQTDVRINCIEFLDHNLYVGTSASELLHFVQIPPDPSEKGGKPAYILASRLEPTYFDVSGASSGSLPGVQQIVLLPRAGKACVQCNWTVTFYSLPEMSPAFPTRQIKGCNFIGGIDLNELEQEDDGDGPADVTVLASASKRIQAIRIGNELKPTQKIELPGVTWAVRRESIACVADSKSYSLLDVERQLRIPLMSISSLDESPSPAEIGHAQSLPTETGSSGIQRSSSSSQNRPSSSALSHSRSKSESAEGLLGASLPAAPPSPQPSSESTSAPPTGDKPLPEAPSRSSTPVRTSIDRPQQRQVFLKPHIASPTPEEFLVFRGTSPVEPCIGMFVNLDGDPTRAPVIFDRYPKAIAIDGSPVDLSLSRSGLQDEESGFILASLAKEFNDELHNGIEIQSLDANNNSEAERHWLEAEGVDSSIVYGIRSLAGKEEIEFEEIVERLCQRRFQPFSSGIEASTSSLKSVDSRTALSMERLSKEQELFERDFDSQDDDSLPEGWESTRNSEAEEFARRLAKAESRLVVWAGSQIWWAIRNPLIIRLDAMLEAACPKGYAQPQLIDRRAFVATLGSIRNRDAKTELEFLSLGYLKQKAGVLLLTSLLRATGDKQFSDSEVNALQGLLAESSLDPRVVLSLVPGVRNEIVEGRRGIWIYGGVKQAVDVFLRSPDFVKVAKNTISTVEPRILHFLRKFLTAWRGMKGMPSVSDETEVFKTVDAALLLVLLELDKNSPPGLGRGGSVRDELYKLVDKGADCFDRAVDLLESYNRLFVLSRLYQSRKRAGDVLATWKRIVEGERDDGQEFRDGEQRVREYLTNIRSQPLVQEYGVWLANRNPKLGVQVFTEDKGKAPKFDPIEVVEILKEEAPNAVKYYLEHLVFGKGNTTYVNDLISYYVDVVVDELQSSKASQDAIMATYDAYRALQAPKPTYQQFLTDNTAEDNEVWHSRLRLLQLLGGSHHYDAVAIRDRIAGLPDDLLVPETIVLAGQERNHEAALRLLVHKLGDYDTAVSYCLRGGTSLDSSPSSQGLRRADSLPTVEQQRRLFQAVLHEFLAIADASDRIEQTGALLERFGGWFEIDEVLELIPDNWSVDIVAGFLIGALRRVVREKHETKVTKALSGAENLRVSYDVVVKMDEKGPSIEAPT